MRLRMGPLAARSMLTLAPLVTLAATGAAPATETTSAPASLAAVDSVLKACAALPDGNADVARQQLAQLEKGHSPQELDQLRGSDAYQSAYQSTTDMLAKVDESELKKVCGAGTAGKP